MKKNPYYARLARFKGTQTMVIIQRDGCSDLTGQIKKVDDQGCLVLVARDAHPSHSEGRASMFVALKDIRGVGHIPVQ